MIPRPSWLFENPHPSATAVATPGRRDVGAVLLRNARRVAFPALMMLAVSVAAPSGADALLGDCGQPQSNGALPNTSDALFVLQHAVGVQGRDCEPCVCDVDSKNGATATDALTVLRAAVFKDTSLLKCIACGTTTSSTSSTSTSSSSTSTTTSTTLNALTWGEIQAVFDQKCSGDFCHTNGQAAGSMSGLDDFDAGYTSIVNADSSCFNAPDKRVVPGDADQSFLMQKLDHTQGCGGPMPQGAAQLDQATRDGIRNWILSGAPKNAR